MKKKPTKSRDTMLVLELGKLHIIIAGVFSFIMIFFSVLLYLKLDQIVELLSGR